MSYELAFNELLNQMNPALIGRLHEISRLCKPLLTYTAGHFPFYTPHDFSHSENVEEILNEIVPDDIKSKMNAYEIFFLIIAAWLHDWGMVCQAGENPEHVRENHHIRTADNFERLFEKVKLREHEARLIGLIAKGHRKADLNHKEYDDCTFEIGNKIRPRFLAALLRIADECDIAHNRTPEVIYYSINPTDKSEEEFKKHLSIAGVGRLEEKHKLYIHAVAKDPKGARALRAVRDKIQKELDGVKHILAKHGVDLDYVDLRLETRGFIDKPISFEVERKNIVNLLIGDHLYSRKDVAIRELIQNAIDSCRIRTYPNPNYRGKITITKFGNNRICIEDDGVGMSFSEAKKFLSSLGTSFYSSDELKDILDGRQFDPISKFGIGILSCFLMSDSLKIDTRKDNEEPCLFTIESAHADWKYEKSHRQEIGTRIELTLNEFGQKIDLTESLSRYFLCPDIPIYYGNDGETLANFQPMWEIKEIHKRYYPNHASLADGNFKDLLTLTSDDYDIIISQHTHKWLGEFFLFNHGIFVNMILDMRCRPFMCVNLKRNLVDLHVSREDVIINDKWSNFLAILFNRIFCELQKKYDTDSKFELIKVISSMIDYGRHHRDMEDFTKELESPFMKTLLEHALFPCLLKGSISFLQIKEMATYTHIPVYYCHPDDIEDEIKSLTKLDLPDLIVICPYSLPKFHDQLSSTDALMYLFSKRGQTSSNLYVRDLLIKMHESLEVNYSDIVPRNVNFGTFPDGVHPLVVVNSTAKISLQEEEFEAYWEEEAILFLSLLDTRDRKSYLEFSENMCGNASLIDEHTVVIDANDYLVSTILAKRKIAEFESRLSRNVYRYFKYLSYLPLLASSSDTSAIALEVLSSLESEISLELGIIPPPPVFDRISTFGKLCYKFSVDTYPLYEVVLN